MGSADHSITTVVARRLPRSEAWLDDAPCRGMWWLTDIPPDLTRHHARASVVAAMRPALELCADCPFTRECLARVEPRLSFYDGVCGGLVWRNGEPIGGLTGVVERVA
jgi:WhiB family redox-sensing transcriptional regulator